MGHRLYLTARALAFTWALGWMLIGGFSLHGNQEHREAWRAREAAKWNARPVTHVRDGAGRTLEIPADQFRAALDLGYTVATPADIAAFHRDVAHAKASQSSEAALEWFGLLLLSIAPLASLVAFRRWWLWLRGSSPTLAPPLAAEESASSMTG